MRAFFAIFTAVLAFFQVAAAIPPACLLAALGVQDNPSDLKAVCGDLQHAIQGNLTSNCHKDTLPVAYGVYSSKCLEEGMTVAKLPTSTSSAQSSTGTASATGVKSVSASASASATPTGDATATSGQSESSSTTESGSTPTPTGNAGTATEPKPFLFAAAALLATGLTSVIFL
ncbi:hypothetical protein F4813DRAFT_27635 [Daldinia decipiens]|uniref:uncharacterized protein n=1 Tax=Daldinia decipiens TaxID=326647 RepID=UPI0020C2B1C1|nr:uncharacterized protein F4813DRAFT_27635 [Daldinia decipiens]KAI1659289.1 hypothetical protein F4813DRAFT_27635 [Daldinia decipiens]